jgi:hypothetical protein
MAKRKDDEVTEEQLARIRAAKEESLRELLQKPLAPALADAIEAELIARAAPPAPTEESAPVADVAPALPDVWRVKVAGFISRDGMHSCVAAGTAVQAEDVDRYRAAGFVLERASLFKSEDLLGRIIVQAKEPS